MSTDVGPDAATSEPSWVPPGAGFTAQLRPFGPPMLRMRYRDGVLIGPGGFPAWELLARAVVQLPAADPALTIDELRVLDVLTANQVLAASGDPLGQRRPLSPTPAGWTWAYLRPARTVALVPVEAYNAFRHPGGLSVFEFDRKRYGLLPGAAGPLAIDGAEVLAPELLARMEQSFGFALPTGYRQFLAETNGGTPAAPGVHPDFGFVLDQPFFGVNRSDPHQDLIYANGFVDDRITREFFAVGYVQGGLLAVKVRGDDTGSVWYLDNDDPRDDDRYDPAYLCANLLHRVADDFGAFLAGLSVAPERLAGLARSAAQRGAARRLTDVEDLGASLPADRRPPDE